MTSDLDIYRFANELIKQHGEDAPIHAAMRADELMENGDMDGRALVEIGRHLKFHDKIGLLGSTGRSTGAHLHYEILFKGKAKNPMKFIKAGRHVFQE